MESVSTTNSGNDAFLIEGIGNEVIYLLTVLVVLLSYVFWRALRLLPAYRRPTLNTPVPRNDSYSSDQTAENPSQATSHDVLLHETGQSPSSTGNFEHEFSNESLEQLGPTSSVRSRFSEPVFVGLRESEEIPTIGHSQSQCSERPSQTPKAITVRIKYLDDRIKTVSTSPLELVEVFKRTHFSDEIEARQQVRLIYSGREIKDDGRARLIDYGIDENATIHCLITAAPASQTTQQSTDSILHLHSGEGDVDLGSLMVPSCGLILVCVWYSRFMHCEYYNGFSTVALLGITVLYLAFLYKAFIAIPTPSPVTREPSDPTHESSPLS